MTEIGYKSDITVKMMQHVGGDSSIIAAAKVSVDGADSQMQLDREASAGLGGVREGRTVSEAVNHPDHYGGADNPYEAIKVIEAWRLGFCLGNAVKYISRAGKKDAAKLVEDLKKARWYLDREIQSLDSNVR